MANGQEGKMVRQCWIDLCWQRMSAVMCIVWWVCNRCGQEKIQEVKEKAKRVVEIYTIVHTFIHTYTCIMNVCTHTHDMYRYR